jgi:hypothetical protein
MSDWSEPMQMTINAREKFPVGGAALYAIVRNETQGSDLRVNSAYSVPYQRFIVVPANALTLECGRVACTVTLRFAV